MSNINQILGMLNKVRRVSPNEWMACCPAHDDRTPSLSITDDNGKIILYCHGCKSNGSVICGALGISESELFPDINGQHIPYDHHAKTDQEQEKKHNQAKIKAKSIWEESTPAVDHPYLLKKSVKAHGARVYKDKLVLPLYNGNGELCSLQFIDPDGGKRFMSGGQVKGCYYRIGKPNGTICIAEGFATAATIHQATGYAVIVAFSASNIELCSLFVRSTYPESTIIICADDDTNGVGINNGMKAAESSRADLVLPVKLNNGGKDFNDMGDELGLDAVSDRINSAITADAIDNTSYVYKHDMKKPPGLVGKVADYINSQCRYPRENLAVISALVTVGNIGGLFHKLENNKLSSNLFAFCVAGSATGKEAVLQAVNELHIVAGVSAAIHGSIKSEQEIIRNLIRNQAAFYIIDELGLFLRKLNMSHKSGGASYLQGVIGILMAAYSKANGSLLLSGDVKEEIKADLNREFAALNKMADDGKTGLESRMDDITDTINNIDKGLSNPFLSLIGFSTPSTFNESVSFEQITSGFIGRSIIIDEKDTNPKRKKGFIAPEMTDDLEREIQGLLVTGTFKSGSNRVESNGSYNIIKTTQEALDALDEIADWFETEAEKHTENTGFEAVVRRGYEMVEKISFILSFGGTERGIEQVEWASEYIRMDIEYKTQLAYSNVKEKSDPVKSMAVKILCSIDDSGITVGKITNRYRAKKPIVDAAITLLESQNRIYSKISYNKFNKKEIKTLYKV